MPAYRAAGIDIRLSVFPLEDIAKLQGLDGEGLELYEESMPFMGEEHGPYFLSECSNAPFLFVRARGVKKDLKEILMEKIKRQMESPGRAAYSLRDLDSRRRRSDRSISFEQSGDSSMLSESTQDHCQDNPVPKEKKDEYSDYKQLLLTIRLDPKDSFSRALELKKTKDMKIDIYLNGSLVQCCLISTRNRHHEIGQVIKVSGIRSGRASEKAWIIQVHSKDRIEPSSLDEDVEMRNDVGSQNSMRLRWENIHKALLESADQYGYKKGERPPSGEYLACLADSPIPHDLEETLGHSESHFAVLDCVITLGSGTKYPVSHGYLRKPKILKDRNFQESSKTHESPLHMWVSSPAVIGDSVKTDSSKAPNSAFESSQGPEWTPGESEALPATEVENSLTDSLAISKPFSKGPFRVPRKGSGSGTSALPLSDSALSDTVEPTTPITTAIRKATTGLTLRYRTKAIDPTDIEPAQAVEAVTESSSEQNGDTITPYKTETDEMTTPQSSARRPWPKVPLIEPGWAIPQLSEGSVVTYVNGQGHQDGIRTIRTERCGTFNEDEILLGVRYLLGFDAAAS